MTIVNNIKDTALIFEGGGMRASYTSGILNNLLENEIYFDYVAGISAGSSLCVNYLSRDIKRTKRSFVDLVQDPNFGGWISFLKRKGFFNSQYIYEEAHYPDAALPYDFKTFMANPARLRIGAFDKDSGETKYFTKDDIHDINDLMKIVRSSSSLPVFMPHTYYNNHYYVDGGVAGGIALDIAKKDGFKKFFVVLTREKGFRKKAPKIIAPIKVGYYKHPFVVKALLNRYKIYNHVLDELEQLQSEGKAYVVYPECMPVSNRETNFDKLSESYRLGYAQGQKDIPKWKEFLGIIS